MNTEAQALCLRVILNSNKLLKAPKSYQLFISNINYGIQSVHKFRKKVFTDQTTSLISNKLALLVMG